MNIVEFRQKYPQYNDLTDEDVSKNLHEKYYADLPFEEFSSKFLTIKDSEGNPLSPDMQAYAKDKARGENIGFYQPGGKPIPPPPKEKFTRGFLGNVATALPAGAVDTLEQYSRALRTLDPQGGVDLAENIGTLGVSMAEKLQKRYPNIFKAPEDTFGKAIYGGFRSIIPSVAAGLPGAAVGSIGGVPGAIGGFALSGGTVFGLAEYDRFMDEAKKQGVPEDIAHSQAIKSAFWEGGWEAASDAADLLMLRLGRPLKAPLKSTLKDIFKTPLKSVVAPAARVSAVEVPTEMIQEAGGAKFRKDVGMESLTPWEAAKEAIGPSLVMSALFGLGGAGINAKRKNEIKIALTDSSYSKTVRDHAASQIANSLIEQGRSDLAEAWMTEAAQKIDKGEAISLEEDIGAYPEIQKKRVEAEKRKTEGISRVQKEMATPPGYPLLPSGQGFTVVEPKGFLIKKPPAKEYVAKRGEVSSDKLKQHGLLPGERKDYFVWLKKNRSILRNMKQEISAGTPGTRQFDYGTEGQGGTPTVTGIPSTYPEYFRNKGLGADEVNSIIDKALKYHPVTQRQRDILYDIVEHKRRIDAQQVQGVRQRQIQARIKPEEIPAGDLSVGDEFTIKGEKFRVTGEDKEGNLVIKDGKTFIVDPFDKVPIDKGKRGITKEAKNVTEKIRKDERQLQGEGVIGQGREAAGGQDIQQPEKARPEASYPEGQVRQPWQMTNIEYSKSRVPTSAASQIKSFQKSFAAQHTKEIEAAIARGETIPLEVLKDYPDLKAKQEISHKQIKPGDYINDITREEAGKLIARGRKDVVPHIEEGVQVLGKSAMQDAIRNEEMKVIQRAKKGPERDAVIENIQKVEPKINKVLKGQDFVKTDVKGEEQATLRGKGFDAEFPEKKIGPAEMKGRPKPKIEGQEDIFTPTPKETEKQEGLFKEQSAEYGETTDEWRDTSKWDMPEFKTRQEDMDSELNWFKITPEQSIEQQKNDYLISLRENYQPPVRGKFIEPENVDEISRAILAAKEGKIPTHLMETVVYRNLPLPSEEQHGSGMVGDIYSGTIENNIGYYLAEYLKGRNIQRYDLDGKLEYWPTKSWGDFREEEISNPFNDNKYIRAGKNNKGEGIISHSEESARDYWEKYRTGKPILMDDGGLPVPGSGYFKEHPELWDEIISGFRENPIKILRDILADIKLRIGEDAVEAEIFMEYYGPGGTFTKEGIEKMLMEQKESLDKSMKKRMREINYLTFGTTKKKWRDSHGNIIHENQLVYGKPAPMFYSQMQQSLEAKLPNTGPPSAFRALIKGWANKGEFKLDEYKWSGIDEWLAEKKGKITKQEVLDWLRANEVRVEEVEKSDEFSPKSQAIGTYVKFQDYTLPGGENYKELLLTLPMKSYSALRVVEKDNVWGLENKDGKFLPMNSKAAAEAAYNAAKEKEWRMEKESSYRSSHWDEPNVLAHVRFNERTDKDGKKVLFIEEIQSDWAAEGRRKGFITEAHIVELSELPEGYNVKRITSNLYAVTEPDGTHFVGTQAVTEKAAVASALQILNRRINKEGTVPNAPLLKNWQELILKRMLRYAAENNFDKLAWTTGAMQQDRYDLSKQVDEVVLIGKSLRAYKNNKEVINKQIAGDSEVEDYIGKEPARKLLAQEGTPVHGSPYVKKSISGLDLKVGGEWASRLYDQMIPQFLNKYGKKWGARVSQSKIPKVVRYDDERVLQTANEVRQNWGQGTVYDTTIGRNIVRIEDIKDGHNYYLISPDASGYRDVPSLTITPAMKSSVLHEGQALFEKKIDYGKVTSMTPKKGAGDISTGKTPQPEGGKTRPYWADELESVGGKIDPDGTVLLYHATTKEAGDRILKEGTLRRPSNTPDSYGVYLSSNKSVSEDYGDGTVIAVRVKMGDIKPDDVVPGKRLDFHIQTNNGVYRPVAVGDKAIRPEITGSQKSEPQIIERDLPLDVEGYFDDKTNVITISSKLSPERKAEVIRHELQHAEQLQKGKLPQSKYVSPERSIEAFMEYFTDPSEVLSRASEKGEKVGKIWDEVFKLRQGKDEVAPLVVDKIVPFEDERIAPDGNIDYFGDNVSAKRSWNERRLFGKLKTNDPKPVIVKQKTIRIFFRGNANGIIAESLLKDAGIGAFSNTPFTVDVPVTKDNINRLNQLRRNKLKLLPSQFGSQEGGPLTIEEVQKQAYEKATKEIDRITKDKSRVSSTGGSLGHSGGIRRLGIAIRRDLIKNGQVDLRKHKVETAEDLAVLAQVLRNPQFETVRFFYMKGNKIVAHEGVTSRMPGESSIFIKDPIRETFRIKSRMKRLGADGYYILHNHPSGDPSPSYADVNMTMKLSAKIEGFKGHVIIDSGKYAVITDEVYVFDLPKQFQEDMLLTPELAHEHLGKKIMGPRDVAAVGQTLKTPDNFVVVIYRGTKADVRALEQIPINLFSNTGEVSNYMRNRARDFGAIEAFSYYDGSHTQKYMKSAKKLGIMGILRDSVYISGSIGIDRHPPSREWMGRTSDKTAMRVSEEIDDYIKKGWRPTKIIDRLFRLPIKVVGGLDADGRWRIGVMLHRKLVEAVTSKNTGGRYPTVDRLLEVIREGLIDKYGMPEDYIGYRKLRELERNAISQEGLEFFHELRTLGEDELKTVNDILTNKDMDPGQWETLTEPIRNLIVKYGQDMVDTKILSPDAFEKNKSQYLHRSYEKYRHESPAVQHAFRKIKLIGKELKHRGQTKYVSPNSVDKWLNGEKDGHPWDSRGVVERQFYQGRNLIKKGSAIIWRDWTKEEREQMGEIEDAAYNVAMTFDLIAKDLSTGKLYKRIAEDPLIASEDPVEGWVHFGNEKITKSSTPKWGALADHYVHPAVAKDLKLTEKYTKPTTWRWLLGQWKLNKALALDTPIPTPAGWTTMGEIQVGDEVFDENGNVCRVLEVKEVQVGRPCYEVVFSDDTKIVADEDHFWFTINRSSDRRGRGEVVTTKQILETLKEPTRGDNNYSIPVAGALELPPADLYIPPYALGVWLGDGDSSKTRISTGMQDADEVIAHLINSGVRCSNGTTDKRSGVKTFTIQRNLGHCPRNHDLSKKRTDKPGCRACDQEGRWIHRQRTPITTPHINTKMQEMGLLGNKYIPIPYLRSSVTQRFELLKGLMDSDGWITDKGTCGFSTSFPALRDGVVELLRSLGYKPTIKSVIPTCNGKIGKRSWRIHFQAYTDKPVFHLSRKIARLRHAPSTKQRSQTRQIIAVTPVKSVPVRCIAVSSKSNLYLAGDGMIPTHNTARNPVVHTNNMVSNVFLADMHDMGISELISGIQSYRKGDKYYEEARTAGVFGHNIIGAEIKQFYNPEIYKSAKSGDMLGTAWGMVKKGDSTMVNLYSQEDDIFRVALFKKLRLEGKTLEEAATEARRQFIDYDISAPWIVAARHTVIPFISYSYRAVPLISEVALTRPWKLAKYYVLFTGIQAATAAMMGIDDKEERKLLSDWYKGRTWAGVEKMVRTPVGHVNISRWLPGADIFDVVGQKGLIPFVNIGGPIDIGISLYHNFDPFTERSIVRKEIPAYKKGTDVSLWIYRQLGPNAPWVPGSYSWDKIVKSFKGVTDELGRPLSPGTAIPSTFGFKITPFDPEIQRLRLLQQIRSEMNEARSVIRQAGWRMNKGEITKKQFDKIRNEQLGIINKKQLRADDVDKTARKLMKSGAYTSPP